MGKVQMLWNVTTRKEALEKVEELMKNNQPFDVYPTTAGYRIKAQPAVFLMELTDADKELQNYLENTLDAIGDGQRKGIPVTMLYKHIQQQPEFGHLDDRCIRASLIRIGYDVCVGIPLAEGYKSRTAIVKGYKLKEGVQDA